MKKLSLLIFAILILGCGTDTEVVEEPVIEEPPPVVMEQELSHHPLIADGPVKHGQVNVDPKPLNRDGFRFQFTEPFISYQLWLEAKDGKILNWDVTGDSERDGGHFAWRHPKSEDDYLEYDTEYKLLISFHDSDCESGYIVIQFRTKPRRPVVGRAAPVIQERIPVAPLGERFQLFDIEEPHIVAVDVLDGDDNVDPEPLNENGIQIEFDRDINRYKIDLRLHEGASLGWLPRGLVKPENPAPHIKITPAEGFPLLEFDTAYEIDIFAEDHLCLTLESKIAFRTKPKP